MHSANYRGCFDFISNHIKHLKETKLKIADIGSYDVNGSIKKVFTEKSELWEYTGMDLTEGPNVDVVAKDKYNWPFEKQQFDIVISLNAMEHVENLMQWAIEINRILKSGGILFIMTPFNIHEHRCPVDCFRILPDGMKYIFGEMMCMEILECTTYQCPSKDTYLVAKKP